MKLSIYNNLLYILLCQQDCCLYFFFFFSIRKHFYCGSCYTYFYKPTSTCSNLGLISGSKELWGLTELKALSVPFYAWLLLCHKGLCFPIFVLHSFISATSSEIISALCCFIASTHSPMLEYLLNSP